MALNRKDHISYLKSVLLDGLPEPFVSLDTSRLSGIYFVIMGLDILGALDEIDKDQVMYYVLAMQIPADPSGAHPGHCGFIGSPFLGQPFGCNDCGIISSDSLFCVEISEQAEPLPIKPTVARYMQGHLAMTYTSLAILLTLDPTHTRFPRGADKDAIVAGIKLLQQPEGSFRATFDGSECDMRFLYCACAISAMLGDWSGVDVPRAVAYVRSCLTYEGGIALVPGAEAHGGSCYTGVAALVLMGQLDAALGEFGKEALREWCYGRVHEAGGFNGRTNKDTDSCYSFWVGATMSMLGAFDDCDHAPTARFLLDQCQNARAGRGGFSKAPELFQDPVHTFYSLCWLSMSGHLPPGEKLRTIDVRLATCSDRVQARTLDSGQLVYDV